MQPFSAGAVLSRSFSIWLKNLIPFTILTLLVFSPLLVYTFLLLGGDLTQKQVETWGWTETILGAVLSLIATAALTYGTFQQLRGQRAGIGESIGVGLKLLFPVLGVGILAAILTLGPLVLVLVHPVFVLLALPVFVVVACMLWVAVPVAVVEQPGVGASLQRSAELTRGSRWHIFGVIFTLGIINAVVNNILNSTLIEDTPTMDDIKMFMILTVFVSIVLGALQAVASAVGYHDLRQSKEGVGIEELAKVFE